VAVLDIAGGVRSVDLRAARARDSGTARTADRYFERGISPARGPDEDGG
jgi:hypothetical protein